MEKNSTLSFDTKGALHECNGSSRHCHVCNIYQQNLGVCREMVIANVFGRGYLTDIFYAAFSVPDLMYYLLVGGALSAAFIPVFTSYLAKDDEETGWEVASTF